MKNGGRAANQSCHGNDIKVVQVQITTIHDRCHLDISDFKIALDFRDVKNTHLRRK